MGTLLVLKVTKRPGEIEVSIDSSFSDDAACLLDTVDFYLTLGFMVLRHFNSFSSFSHDASGVTSVNDIYLS